MLQLMSRGFASHLVMFRSFRSSTGAIPVIAGLLMKKMRAKLRVTSLSNQDLMASWSALTRVIKLLSCWFLGKNKRFVFVLILINKDGWMVHVPFVISWFLLILLLSALKMKKRATPFADVLFVSIFYTSLKSTQRKKKENYKIFN